MKLADRIALAKYFKDQGFKIGAEIGVLKGEYAKVLCETIPNLRYYGVDSWRVGGDWSKHIHRNARQRTEEILKDFEGWTLIQKESLEAVKDFEDSSLDFVYIDADHEFDAVVQDIIAWTKKVRKGGIVSGHDYVVASRCGVIPAVNGYTQTHKLELNLTSDLKESISWWFRKKWNT